MIRWCGFCQKYLGVVRPYDNYAITHGMCEQCSEREAWDDEEGQARLRDTGRDLYERPGRVRRAVSPRATL